MTNIIANELFTQFPHIAKKAITLKYLLKTIEEAKGTIFSQINYHFDGHWNEIYIENEFLVFCYSCGGTGKRGEEYARIKMSEIGRNLFFIAKDGIVYFTKNKDRKDVFNVVYISYEVYYYATEVQIWLKSKGVPIYRKVLVIGKNLLIHYETVFL